LEDQTVPIGQPAQGSALARSSTSNECLAPGTRLGNHRIVRLIGAGGMSQVYEAEHILLQRRVALKVLPRSLASDKQTLKRFIREAKLASRLNHPNVVALYEIGQHHGIYYLVLEYVSGGSADDFLRRRGPFHWRDATQIMADVCRGLIAAHLAGLIHRDIKPGNIVRSKEDGTVKLADFGLAKSQESNDGLTSHGLTVGTPHYMSPELCQGLAIDERSDIYSMGATYFALLTGKPPFEAEQPLQVLCKHITDPVPDPRSILPSIDERCVPIIQRAMAKLPKDRYRTAAELLYDLEALLKNTQDPNLPRRQSGWLSHIRQENASDLVRRTRSLGRPPSRTRSRILWWVIAIILCSLFAMLLGVVLALLLFAPTRMPPAPMPASRVALPPLTIPKPPPPGRVDGVLTTAEATQHPNKYGTVQFLVQSVGTPPRGGLWFLNSEPDYRSLGNFSAILPAEVVQPLGLADPEALKSRFIGKLVSVSGLIVTRNRQAQITIEKMDDLRVID
jgi:serine/threonine protein kinase